MNKGECNHCCKIVELRLVPVIRYKTEEKGYTVYEGDNTFCKECGERVSTRFHKEVKFNTDEELF